MAFLYTSDVNKQTSQDKTNEITLDIFGSPEDADNLDEESELRTTFGNYEMFLYFLCFSYYSFLPYKIKNNCILIYAGFLTYYLNWTNMCQKQDTPQNSKYL